MKGLVVKNTGSWYTVLTDDGQLIESKVKGNFRLKGIRSTNPVAVGDRVELVANAEGTAFITAIEDRRNYIIRRSQNLSKQSHIIAANVDQAFLVVTVDFPQTSTTFIDRFLASAEAYRVPVVLVFNKTDLLDADLLRYQQMMMVLYESIGYHCVAISAETGEGIEALRPLLQQKITLLSGNSGVGKSRWWLAYRYTRHQGLRYLRYGTRGAHQLFPRDIPFLKGLSFLQLHPYP